MSPFLFMYICQSKRTNDIYQNINVGHRMDNGWFGLTFWGGGFKLLKIFIFYISYSKDYF